MAAARQGAGAEFADQAAQAPGSFKARLTRPIYPYNLLKVKIKDKRVFRAIAESSENLRRYGAGLPASAGLAGDVCAFMPSFINVATNWSIA